MSMVRGCRIFQLAAALAVLMIWLAAPLFVRPVHAGAARTPPTKAPPAKPVPQAEQTTPPIRILVVGSEAEAQAVLDAVKAGKPFETLVREKSIGPEKERGGYLGRVDAATLSPEAAAALAKTRPGEVSTIFRVEKGFGILQVVAEKDARELDAQVRREDGSDLLRRGVEMGRAGDLEGAVALLRQAVERDPTLANAYYNLAIAYRRLGRTDEAIASMRETTRLQPKDFDAFMRLGDWLAAGGKTEDAIAQYEKASLIRMDSQEAWRALAKAYETAGRDKDALGAYRRLLALTGQSEPSVIETCLRLAIKLQDGPAAVDVAERLSKIRPTHESFLLLGDAYLLNSQWQEAIREYQKGILLAPNSVQGRLGLGKAYAKTGQLEPAAEQFLKVVQLQPDRPDTYQELASVYEQMGRLDLAIVAMRDGVAAAARITPAAQAELADRLATLYDKAGMSRDAELQRERAKALRSP
ncbi:MAG TPA: tetratricopeptide repeat protein [Candidatus Baltobacteraceae bacterium]|nr:tetratricopeptide repeat protein [Candidatus Baltobacteraceae bacterium]